MADLHSPFLSSPSPSHPLPPGPRPISWHFPGPSSKYHTRERERPKHTRFQSSTTAPIAPNLSTERRAHRRTQSTAQFAPEQLRPEHSRSPFLRSRFSSYTSSSAALSSPAMAPVTPVKHLGEAGLRDSPFSDYFTDEARSIGGNTPGVPYNAPDAETHKLLARLHKLTGMVMQGGEEAQRVVSRKMSEIEEECGALHSRTRMPFEMDDSGFIDEDEQNSDTPEAQPGDGLGLLGLDGTTDSPEPQSPKGGEYDDQLAEARRILANIQKANEQLQQRHAELVELNDTHINQIEDREAELEGLKTENEGMRTDLGFDHSELLFLKLQMKYIEVQVEAIDGFDETLRNAPAESKEAIKRVRRSEILEEMRHWRQDWHDVNARFKRRRSRFGVLSANERDSMLEQELDAEPGEEGEWQLEIVKEGQNSNGRPMSITVRRRQGRVDGHISNVDGAADEEPSKPEHHAAQPESQGTVEHNNKPEVELEEPSPHGESSQPMENINDHGVSGSTFGMYDRSPQPPHVSMVDSSTQTDPISEPPSLIDEDDECAITTSPATPEQASPAISAMQKPIKSAWTELWEGLNSLAGMGLDDD